MQTGVQSIIPFCIANHVVPPTLRSHPEIRTLIQKIQHSGSITPYPILAGSAVYLGIGHINCDDVDLVAYVPVGAKDDERKAVGRFLRQLVTATRPTELKASVIVSDNKIKKLSTKRSGGTADNLLDRILGEDPTEPDPEIIVNLASAQLIFDADPKSLGKQMTLKIHCTPLNFVDTDIHPHQELPECDEHDFFHTNKHWLAPSFVHFFRFLIRGVNEQQEKQNIVKAAKRAAMLAGMAGDWDVQKEIIDLITASTTTTKTKDIGSIVDNLRREIATEVTLNGLV
ncbi:hypothetical protein [Kordiimonas sp.]|uniref:hypothetical protein n=1 Tax=Kordiimonas sp. TaxID=1970157 RepID=UPI003A8FCC74